MAIITRKASDLSGKEGPDEKFSVVVVRQHPDFDQPKALDVLKTELDQFKGITNLVIVEIKKDDGSTEEISMPVDEFNKLAPDMNKVMENARGTRGRIPGSRNGS